MKILDEIHPPKLKNQKMSIPANLFGFVLSGETYQIGLRVAGA
jgi:hypothetical protein